MFRCLLLRRELALRAVGGATGSTRSVWRLDEHLRTCARCRRRMVQLERVIETVRRDPLLDLAQEIDWAALRDRTVAAAKTEGERIEGVRLRLAAAGLAIAVVLAMVWSLVGGQRRTPMDPVRSAFLERMEAHRAAGDVASYLAESRGLLTGVLAPLRCESSSGTEALDVALEKTRARDLLWKRRLVDPELESPALARALPVSHDLDLVLLEIAELPECAPRERLADIEAMLRSSNLLVRLKLVAGEI